jgi:hypothetical protein
MIQEKDGNLLIRLCANVDAAVNAFGWLVPIYLPGLGGNELALPSATTLPLDGNGEG